VIAGTGPGRKREKILRRVLGQYDSPGKMQRIRNAVEKLREDFDLIGDARDLSKHNLLLFQKRMFEGGGNQFFF